MKELFLVNHDHTEIISLNKIFKYEIDLTYDNLQPSSVDLSLDFIVTLPDGELYFSDQMVSIVITQEEYEDVCEKLILDIKKVLSKQINTILIQAHQQEQELHVAGADCNFILQVEDYINLERAVKTCNRILSNPSTEYGESAKKKGFKFFN